MNNTVEPTVEQDTHSDTVEKHPAYAQISASRVQGNATLYGSEFNHQHYITISIKASELHRSLNRDWHFAKKEYIEVSLSEAQWATFISTPNSGSGTPCTLSHFKGELIPEIKRVKHTKDKFTHELGEDFKNIQKSLGAFRERILSLKISEKARKELLSSLGFLERGLGGNLDFIMGQFDKHMEKTIESAKVEVEAYVQGQIVKAGLEALKIPLLTQEDEQ
jgi:hypothetical protein